MMASAASLRDPEARRRVERDEVVDFDRLDHARGAHHVVHDRLAAVGREPAHLELLQPALDVRLVRACAQADGSDRDHRVAGCVRGGAPLFI